MYAPFVQLPALRRLAPALLAGIVLASGPGADPGAQALSDSAPGRSERYVDAGEGVVLDRLHGLLWQKCALGQSFREGRCRGDARLLTWKQATLLCLSLDWAGRSDWRLPDRAELAGLIDPSRTRPQLALEYLPSPYPFRFWSRGTQVEAAGPRGQAVNFLSGLVYAEADPEAKLHARCVRGPDSTDSGNR